MISRDETGSNRSGIATLDDTMLVPEAEAASTRFAFGRRFQVVLLVMLLLELILVGALYVPIPPNPDQELYDYMAWLSIDQGGLYLHGGDMNMPGEAMLHIISMKLFGNHYWSYRLLDYLLFLGSMGAVALLSRKYYGKIFSGLFIALYPVIYATSGPWMTGQRDVISAHCVLLAGFSYLRRIEGGHVGWVLFSGASVALAVLIKPTYLAFAPLLFFFVYLMVRPPLRLLLKDTLIMGGLAGVLLGGVLVAGLATGSVGAWQDMTITYSVQNYIGGHSYLSIVQAIASMVLRSWHWFTVMALVGLILIVPRRPRAPLSVLLAVISTVLVSTVAQRKGFGYHFGGLLSIIAFLGAFYFTDIVRFSMRLRDPKLAFQLLAFPALISIGGLISKCSKEFTPQASWYLGLTSYDEMLRLHRFDGIVKAADYLRSASKPEDKAWINSTHLMVNSLAGRGYPSRFISYAMVRFHKQTDLGDRWRKEVEDVFKAHLPEFIILEAAHPPNPERFFNMNGIQPYEPIGVMDEALKKYYTLDRQVGDYLFYRPDPAKVAASRSQPDALSSTPHEH